MTAIRTPFPPSPFPMSQLVYVPGMTSEPMRYYTADAANSGAAPMQQMTILYPSSTAMHTVPSPPQPPQQQQQQQQYFQQMQAPPGTSYYICPNRVVEVGSNNKVVYLVPSAAPANPGQMSVLIQSNNSSSTTMPVNQSYAAPQEVYTTAQMLPQHAPQLPSMTYVTMTPTMAPKPPQPVMDPATKLALLRSPEVCRHFLNGRCNRRKCRFLHPHLQNAVEPTMMSYIAADAVTPAANHASQPVTSFAAYGGSLSSSMNSYSMPSAQMGWAAPHP